MAESDGSRSARWYKHPSVIAALLAAFATIVAALIAALLRGADGPSGADARTPPPPQTFTVDSRQGWQRTPFTVDPARSWSLHQVSGAWTVDRNKFKLTGAGGYDSAYEQRLVAYQWCKFDRTQPFGYLLAKVGANLETADLVYVGGDYSGSWLAADGNRKVAGPVWLRINGKDECIGDNAGNITVAFAPE